MGNSQGFFSDPKVWLSLLAILISISSFLWTLSYQSEQNRRWDRINEANIVLKEVKFLKWKELSKEEAMTTKWGYEPNIYPSDELDKFQIPYHLVAYDSKARITRINPFFSLPELEAELERIGIKEGTITVRRVLKPKFVFENIGKTDGKNLFIGIEMEGTDSKWQQAFKSNASTTLPTSQIVTSIFSFEIPISISLPKKINFKVSLNYETINGEIMKKEIFVSWNEETNQWSLTNTTSN